MVKKIQKYRLGVQILCLGLTIVGFFIDFEVTMLAIMGLILFSGVFYCGWICPYGFIQDLLSLLGRLLGIKKRKMPIAIQKILVFSRYILFVLFLLIGTDLVFNIMSFDPRVNFGNLLVGNVVAIGAISVMCFFALIALFFERPFCNYLCYEGAKYGLMSYFRIFTVKRNQSSCINCKKCDKTCPMNIEVSKCTSLRSPQCINCFQCVSSCPVKGTLSYGKVNMNKHEKKSYFTKLTAVLLLIGAILVYNILNGVNPLDSEHQSEAFNETEVIEAHSETDVNEDLSSSDETIVITGKSADNLGDAEGIADGVYTGQGEGFKSYITVEVEVKSQQIMSVKVIDHRDDRKWFNRANNVIPDSIVDTQSTDIDYVSGATYSSMGIINGVKDALENAK